MRLALPRPQTVGLRVLARHRHFVGFVLNFSFSFSSHLAATCEVSWGSSAEVSWAELLVSFRLETKCPMPIPCAIHKGTYITEGIHYVPTLEARPLGDEVKAFVNSLRTLTTITGAQIMPWDQTKKIKLVRFGRGLQVQGLSTRPFFPHQESVQSLLTNYFTCANGSISMSTALNLAKIPPSLVPHDALLRRDGLIRSSMRVRTQVSRHYE